jgi:acrylyl-CoA reductase (NADPH)
MTTPETYRAFVAGTDDSVHVTSVRDLSTEPVADGCVRIRVAYSDVNYKDHLAATENGRVARIDPLVPGIDLAGEIVESSIDELSDGLEVLAHGYEIGVARDGGFAQYATVPSDWIVRLPDRMSAQHAMTIGTAGFTAARSVLAITEAGISPTDGPVLVTGATGGVGSIATALLATLGYEVTASTGRTNFADWLHQLGAQEITERLPADAKPLGRETWAAVIDSVGGTTLHAALASVRYGGVVAVSGNTGGARLETTIFPLILRGVSLIGIDSVACPLATRQQIWDWIGTTLPASRYDLLAGDTVSLDGVQEALDRIAAGSGQRRTLVRPGD